MIDAAAFVGNYADIVTRKTRSPDSDALRSFVCLTCKQSKPFNEFYIEKKTVLGIFKHCKECCKIRMRENRQKKLNEYQRYDRERSILPHRRKDSAERRVKYVKSGLANEWGNAWKKRNPEKVAAEQALSYAIKTRKIRKGTVCKRCNTLKRIQAHHEDYSKPLEVIWLCVRCHGARHREINEERRNLASSQEVNG